MNVHRPAALVAGLLAVVGTLAAPAPLAAHERDGSARPSIATHTSDAARPAASILPLVVGASPTAELITADLDQPGPGVVLGSVIPTSDLTAITRTDPYPAHHAVRARPSGTTPRPDDLPVDGAGQLVVPAGRPGLYGLPEHVTPSCAGDGKDGNRVQVVYAVEVGRTDRYREVLPSLLSFVADVDDTFALSSRESGRRVRWITDADCVPLIDDVVVPEGTLAGRDLNPLKRVLQTLGYLRGDRKYLVFADAERVCGIADVYLDDRASLTNVNNGGTPMYGRVDTPCWPVPRGGHSTPAHELMHMLGAVQTSAPHATAANHCTDEHDAMCYADGTATRLGYVCTQPDDEELFDCRRDDYFDPRPVVGSAYLRTHWNTAGSSFLDRVGSSGNDRLRPAAMLAGPAWMRPGTAATLTVRADRSVGVTWAASPSICLPPGATGTRVRLQCPTSSSTAVAVTATLTDARGRRARVRRVVALTGPKAGLGLAVSAPRTVRVGATATVRAAVTHRAVPVRAALSLQQYDRSTRRWRTIATTITDATGIGRLSVRRTTPGVRTLRVVVRLAPRSGWTVAPSASHRLRVVRG